MSPLETIDKLIKKLEFLTFLPRGLRKAATAFCLVDSHGRQTAGFLAGQGAGGAVTQATSKSTAVALHKMCGRVTMFASTAIANSASVSFTVNNSLVEAGDVVLVTAVPSTLSAVKYTCRVDGVAAGAFLVTVTNLSGGSLSEALPINFAVLKAVAS